jgi:hypothetical protein
VRSYADYFDTEMFKVYPVAIGRRERQLLVRAIHESGLNATIHAELEVAITATIDGFSGVEHAHSIRVDEDIAILFGRSGTTYTPTYGADVAGVWEYLFRRYGQLWDTKRMRQFAPPSARPSLFLFPSGPPEWESLRRIIGGSASIASKGGRVGVGSHGNIPGLGLHYEMWLYALGGMATHEILRSATVVGAEAIGHGNPLADIRNATSIRYVMKNGRLYRVGDLTEVWPRHRPLGCLYLWEVLEHGDTGSRVVRPPSSRGARTVVSETTIEARRQSGNEANPFPDPGAHWQRCASVDGRGGMVLH